jgi:hypothetical protein
MGNSRSSFNHYFGGLDEDGAQRVMRSLGKMVKLWTDDLKSNLNHLTAYPALLAHFPETYRDVLPFLTALLEQSDDELFNAMYKVDDEIYLEVGEICRYYETAKQLWGIDDPNQDLIDVFTAWAI